MHMHTVLRSSAFEASIQGMRVDVKLTIWDTCETTFDFTLLGRPYTFVITKWSGRGFARFAALFFDSSEERARDPSRFGALSQPDGGTACFDMDTEQKLNVIEQGVRDVIACVDQICGRCRRSVLDYAAWYIERHPELDSYSQYITWVACTAIAYVDFMAPNTEWELVRFSPSAV